MESPPDISITCATNAREEQAYEALLRRIFRAELDVTVDDEHSSSHGTKHGTLICRCGDQVVAGLKMYMGDIATGRLLPMESDGVPIEDYQRNFFSAEKIYGEVCRVVIHPDYRRHRLHVRLLKAASILLPQQGCHIVYWLAKRSQAVNSHRSLKSLGLEPRIVESMLLQRSGDSSARERVLSVIELPRVPETSAG
ncbi:MAG: GNAT family N-acetyltransferase [Roseibacillus sp.]